MTSVSHDQINRSLGRVEGKTDAMEKRLDGLEKTVADGFKEVGEAVKEVSGSVESLRIGLDKRLGAIEAKEAERKGAWKVVAAVAATVSGVIAWAANYFFGGA